MEKGSPMLSYQDRKAVRRLIDAERRAMLSRAPHNLTGLPDGSSRSWLPVFHVPSAAHRILPTLDQIEGHTT
jgi:hypothetical protein